MIKIAQGIKDKLWWLIMAVDYDYSRISIADHELSSESLVLWLEDKHDFKNTLDECLKLEISLKQFSKIIRSENLNSYEGTKMHPKRNVIYKCRVEYAEPIKWYTDEATLYDQRNAREVVVNSLLRQLVETETSEMP